MEEKGSSEEPEEMESEVELSCGFDSSVVPNQQHFWIDNTDAMALRQWMYHNPNQPNINHATTNFMAGSSFSSAYRQALLTPPPKSNELKKTPMFGSPIFNSSGWFGTPAETGNPNIWFGMPLLEEERQLKAVGESSQSLIQDGVSTTDGSASTKHNEGRKLLYESDRRRRRLISERLKALQELVPQSASGHPADVLEDVIDYVKFLQLQLKDLSQNRLGGEPVTDPLVFIQGYGHYFVHEPMVKEPLDEMIGRLLEVNPQEAAAILESKGLFIRDMTLGQRTP